MVSSWFVRTSLESWNNSIRMGDHESRNPTLVSTNSWFYYAVFWNNPHPRLTTWWCEKLQCEESFTMALSQGRGWRRHKWCRPPTHSSTEVANGYSWLQLYLYPLSVPTLACYGVIFTFTLPFILSYTSITKTELKLHNIVFSHTTLIQ
jgi:hypothetical protein